MSIKKRALVLQMYFSNLLIKNDVTGVSKGERKE
jgi:hypothetical protein